MKRILTIIAIVAVALVAVPAIQAQLQAGATASAVYYQRNWYPGTEQTQQLPVFYLGTAKNNIVAFGTREVIVPSVFELYGGLINYQPDLTNILAKMNFSPQQVSLSFDMAGGVATLPDGTTKPGVEGRLNFQIALTPATSFTGGYAGGGLIGQNRFGTISVGLTHDLFGSPSSTQSVAKKAFNKVYALKHPAK
jgi:hypothetical protein